jgi:hypothetical protein
MDPCCYTPTALGTVLRHRQLETEIVTSSEVTRYCCQRTYGIHTPVRNSNTMSLLFYFFIIGGVGLSP